MTREPLFLYFTPSSRQTVSIISEPRTFSFAFSVPSCASKPAWTIAEFAQLAPVATSFFASRMQIFRSYAESVLAIIPPTTPAPMTAISNIPSSPFLPKKIRTIILYYSEIGTDCQELRANRQKITFRLSFEQQHAPLCRKSTIGSLFLRKKCNGRRAMRLSGEGAQKKSSNRIFSSVC